METFSAIRSRLDGLPTWVVDLAIAIGLTVLTCLQIWLLDRFAPPIGPPRLGGPDGVARMIEPGALAYALAAGAFLPLAVRRSWPWVALGISGLFALFYQIHPAPASFTMIGPMIAMYSVAAYAQRRYAGIVALVVAGLVASVPAIAFSSTRTAAQAVGTFAILAAAMLFGDSTRNRREYITEVERRAAEAEHALEEESRRRVEQERTRIAREVHDIVAHSLSIVAVQAGAAATVMESDPAQARQSIEHIRATSKQALADLRSMLDVLRAGEAEPSLAPTSDLTQLEALIEPVREAGLAVDVRLHGEVVDVPAFASVSAYRIIQEALTNVVRHAAASSVRIAVDIEPTHVEIEVVDNGTSSPPTPTDLDTPGHGLRGMRERVEALGGTFSAGRLESGGFRIHTAIPLTRGA